MNAGKKDAIQWLRALAAIEVVMWHSDLVAKHFSPMRIQGSPYEIVGGAGVELFFVISGYVICLTAPRYRSGAAFMANRVIRLMPLYLAFTALVFLAAWMNPHWTQGSLDFSPEVVVSSLLLLPQPEFPILSLGWSLEHEMLFYGIVAMGIACVTALRLRAAIVIGAVLILLGGAGMMLGTGPSERFWDYHLTSPYMLAFGFGWLIRVAETATDAARFRIRLGLAGTLIVLSLLPAAPDEHFLLQRAVASVAVFLAVICYGEAFAPRDAVTTALARIGDASYSIYLSHLFLLSIAGKLLGVIDPPDGFDALFRFFVIIGCVLVGLRLYEEVEQPLDRFLKRRAARWMGDVGPRAVQDLPVAATTVDTHDTGAPA